MKKPLILLISIIIICTTFSFSFRINADETEDDEAIRTIEVLNQIRERYQIPSLSYSANLTNTAKTHNQYMIYNQSFSSLEEGGKLYFRGRYPWDRASYYGYLLPYVNELISTEVNTMEEGLNRLFDQAASRYALLDPLYRDIGIDQKDKVSSYLLGGEKRDGNFEVLYPYQGQMEVGISSLIPISYSFYTVEGNIQEYSNIQASLINTLSNEKIELKIITPNEDRTLINTILLQPLESLNMATTYELHLEGELYFDKFLDLGGFATTNRKIIDIKSSFTTTENMINSKESFVTRALFVEELMKKSDFIIKESLQPIFPDVNVNATNYKYIYTAYVNNIILGYSDGLYRPGANISREQAYTIMIRAYEKSRGEVVLEENDMILSFKDVEAISNYALPFLYKAKKLGILNDNRYEFNPSTYISETEFQQILERLSTSMGYNQNNETVMFQ